MFSTFHFDVGVVTWAPARSCGLMHYTRPSLFIFAVLYAVLQSRCRDTACEDGNIVASNVICRPRAGEVAGSH